MIFNVMLMMLPVMIVSVHIGDYLVLTVTPDGSWYAMSNCTNVTKPRQCSKCHPGSFANQSMCILYTFVLTCF